VDYAVNFAMLKKAIELDAKRRRETAWMIAKFVNEGKLD